jgi:hypothetical protein
MLQQHTTDSTSSADTVVIHTYAKCLLSICGLTTSDDCTTARDSTNNRKHGGTRGKAGRRSPTITNTPGIGQAVDITVVTNLLQVRLVV